MKAGTRVRLRKAQERYWYAAPIGAVGVVVLGTEDMSPPLHFNRVEVNLGLMTKSDGIHYGCRTWMIPDGDLDELR